MQTSQFADNPEDWDEDRVLQFMQYLKVDKRILEAQKQIRYKGFDFVKFDEEHIIKFFRASSPEEKVQLRQVRNEIQAKVMTFSNSSEDSFGIAQSLSLRVTGNEPKSFQKKNGNTTNTSKQSQTMDNSVNSKNIGVEQSGIIQYHELPFDPFDLDTPLNFHIALNDYHNLLKYSPLQKQFIDFKQKCSQQNKSQTTQLVLEVRKSAIAATMGSQQQANSSKPDKYAIKENMSISLGQTNCELLLEDKRVSRKHAIIENMGSVCNLQDMGSSCGTFVRIGNEQNPLSEGSIFECGYQEFQIQKIQANGDSGKIQLLVYEGLEIYMGKTYNLEIQNKLLIGKDIKCHFGSQFRDDPDLSQYHAKLSMKDNVLSIMDLDSDKGTWLRLSPQKQPSAKFQLTDSTQIKINPFMILVKINQIGAAETGPNSSMGLQAQKSAPVKAKNLGASIAGICLICKEQKANIQIFPCTHVAFCKNCYMQQKPKQCPKSDCNAAIQKVETIYNC